MKIEISIGELLDKASILSIKIKKIKNTGKLNNIRKEFEIYEKAMRTIGLSVKSPEFTELERINLMLWEIEDQIRFKESQKEFDEEFIGLARSVYKNNDLRASLKREINLRYDSSIIEEKEYTDYQ
jgi:hypothetical protein